MTNQKKVCCTKPADGSRVTHSARSVSDEDIGRLSEFFELFGDASRLKILNVLFSSELCVCDIATEVGMSQSAVSHQLRILRKSRVVKTRRDGKSVYYSLDDDHIEHIFFDGLSHIREP